METSSGRCDHEVVELTPLVLTAGDNVLLTMRGDAPDAETARAMVEALRERFPGVEFTVVGGVSGIALQ